MKSESLWVSGNPKEIEKTEKKIWSNNDNIGKDSPQFDEAVPLTNKKNFDYLLSKIEEKNEIALEKEEWFNDYQQNIEEINRLLKEINLTNQANEKIQEKIDQMENNISIQYKDFKINTLKGYISKNLEASSENFRKIEELEKKNDELNSDRSYKIKRIIESN